MTVGSVPTADELAARLATIHERISAAGGDPTVVTVCAVTKGFGVDAVRVALDAGIVDVGENYAQELVSKADALGSGTAPGPRWHMIGPVQRNKVRLIAPMVACWQSVDRLPLGREIATRAPGAAVLVQVNATGEATKSGAAPAEVEPLVEGLADLGLRVEGLMTIGPTDPTVDPRPTFEQVATLAASLGLSEVSMGMSRDLEAAVSCGATMVRIGTSLFGVRPTGVTAVGGSDE